MRIPLNTDDAGSPPRPRFILEISPTAPPLLRPLLLLMSLLASACGQSTGAPHDAIAEHDAFAPDATGTDANADDVMDVGRADVASDEGFDVTSPVDAGIDGDDVASPVDASDGTGATDASDAGSVTDASAPLVWHPGNYLKLISGTAMERDTFLASAGAAQFVGIENRYEWSTSETAMGDYSAGLAAIDADLAAVDAVGKTLLVYLPYKHFNASGPGAAVPGYLTGPGPWCVTPTGTSTPLCGEYVMQNGRTAMIWLPAVADRYIAWVRAVAAHLGPSHPHERALAGIVYPETANSQGSIPLADVGYTQASYVAGIESYLGASAQAFPRHPSFLHINFMPPNNTAGPYLAQLAAFALAHPNVGLGCPDVITTMSTPAYSILGDAQTQQRLPFDVEIQAMDYQPGYNADVASVFTKASAPAPNGFYAGFVTWVNIRNAAGNAFTIADVANYLRTHALPHTAPPTY